MIPKLLRDNGNNINNAALSLARIKHIPVSEALEIVKEFIKKHTKTKIGLGGLETKFYVDPQTKRQHAYDFCDLGFGCTSGICWI